MKCTRCYQDFDDFIPYTNAENYGGMTYYACPHCGKLHVFKRIVIVRPCNDDLTWGMPNDARGNKVVTDEEYQKLQGK